MNELFLKLVNMSISAGWLVLAVLVLRLVLKKAPKWVYVFLWGVVAAKLLCPFSFESALSLIPSAETIPIGIEMDTTPAINSGINAINSTLNPIISHSFAPANGASVNPLQIIIPILSGIWVFGVAVLLAYAIFSYWRLRRKVRTAVLLEDNIFQSENVSSPFVLGIIRPRIYLPFQVDKKDMEHIVAHEKAHLHRKDHWWKPLGFLLLMVYWFNPLMWLAYMLLCRDIELACDEKVIKELNNEQKADYTQALLSCSIRHRMVVACPLAFGEVGVKERVKSVMNYKKPAFWVIVLAMIACVVVAACFLTNPSSQHEAIKWAQTLSADDVRQIELVVWPQAEEKQYKLFSEDEIIDVVSLINGSKGEYAENEESIFGGCILFSITMKDGSTHSVANDANTYLTIDGTRFKAPYAWLSTWHNNYGEGNSVIPESFWNLPANRAEKWFDYYDDPSGMDWKNEITIKIPAFEGITFHYTPLRITVSENAGEESLLFDGMPIWSAYFCDLTGDGLPEICASLSMGSGMIDERIIIYDYANGASYTLEDRGNYDYYLRMGSEDGGLYADKKVYMSNELVESGRLVFKDNCIQLESIPVESR